MWAPSPRSRTAAVPSATSAPAWSRRPSSASVTPLGQAFGGKAVLERADQGGLFELRIDAVHRRGRLEHVRGSREQLGVGGEHRQRRFHRSRTAALHRIRRLVVDAVDQAATDVSSARRQRRLGGGDQPFVASRAGRSELGRPGQHLGSGREPAPSSGAVGDLLQSISHRRIGADRGLGGVPRLELDQVQRARRPRQRVMDLTSVGTRCRVVHRRSHQGMSERGSLTELDQAGMLGVVAGLVIETKVVGGPPDQVDILGRVRAPPPAATAGPPGPVAASGEGSGPRDDDRPGSARRPGWTR